MMSSQGKMSSKEEIANLKAELLHLEGRFAQSCKKLKDLHKDVAEHFQQLEKEVIQVLKDDKWLEAEKLKTENSDFLQKISDLEYQIIQIQQVNSVDSYEMKIKNLVDANAELQKEISDLEKKMVEERSDFETKKKGFAKKFSDFSRKCADEKKTVELKCVKLSQQISDFEKVIIIEREKFAKDKKEIEQKNVGFFKEISDGRKNVEKDFEEERIIFETEIRKLTAKLSELSENALIEQQTKSEFKTKIDLLVKERDSFVSKIKEFEKIVSKVVVTEQTTPESQIHTPRNNLADFKKTASSSHMKPVSSSRLVNSFNLIRTSNIFYDQHVDGSGTQRRRRKYQEEKLVWKVKPVDDDEKNDEKKEEKKGKKKENTSFVSASNAKKNKVLKGTTSQGGVREQWLLNNTVQDPHLNVKNMASKQIAHANSCLNPTNYSFSSQQENVSHFQGDAAYNLSGFHLENMDIEREGSLPHLRTSIMHIESVFIYCCLSGLHYELHVLILSGFEKIWMNTLFEMANYQRLLDRSDWSKTFLGESFDDIDAQIIKKGEKS
ncbi:hypothetical protein L6452_27773 [Arctium lappa]|uniref:Uncharacterized protein n=1 Tax=Arctium lappa TaxID=4217 RepID=A0ACB9A134_ARCLA|nr:hypothetical protein L6452_27773 [Arctium lappa]